MTLNYIEKGNWLHSAINQAGYQLHMIDGKWIYSIADESAIQGIINSFDPLPFAKSDAIDSINGAVNAKLAKIVSPYPPLEKDTWGIQVQEATAYIANSSSATPMLSAIAAHSGQAVSAMVANVINKTAAYTAACAIPIGRRINYTAQVYAAKDWTLIAGITTAALTAIGT